MRLTAGPVVAPSSALADARGLARACDDLARTYDDLARTYDANRGCFDMTAVLADLYYSHVAPAELLGQLAVAGLELVAARDRTIGGETFLWVTAAAPASASAFPAPP